MKTIINNLDGTVTIDGVTYVAQIPSVTPETPKPKLPERWEDLKEIEGVYITSGSGTGICPSSPTRRDARNIFSSKAYAQSALAFAQLSQLYEAWKRIEFPDWVADWADSNQMKYCPTFYEKNLSVFHTAIDISFFPFPFKDLCQAFIGCPEIASLLRTFYMIEQ